MRNLCIALVALRVRKKNGCWNPGVVLFRIFARTTALQMFELEAAVKVHLYTA